MAALLSASRSTGLLRVDAAHVPFGGAHHHFDLTLGELLQQPALRENLEQGKGDDFIDTLLTTSDPESLASVLSDTSGWAIVPGMEADVNSRRSGGRKARVARRGAPTIVNPAAPGQVGGQYNFCKETRSKC